MKIIYIYLTGIILGLTLLNCTRTATKEPGNDSTEIKEIASEPGQFKISKQQYLDEGLEMTELVDHSFDSKISSTGIIDVPPNGRSVISAQIGGYIKNSPLLVGDNVKKGQLLVTIENIEFLELQQHYLEAKEQLTFLESDYHRQKELFDEKITSEKSFLKAESDFKRTLAIYKSLKKKLELLRIDIAEVESGNLSSISKIYAPMSGDITQLNITTGSYVSSSDVIMEIVSTEHLHLELKIFEKDMLKVRIGQTVSFTLPESGATSYKGSVHLIGKSIGSDRTVMVHAHIDESHEVGFIPGMFVQAEILTQEFTGIAISQEAIQEKDGKHYILILKSDDHDAYLFEKIQIEIESSSEDLVFIKSKEKLDVNGKYLIGGRRYLNNN